MEQTFATNLTRARLLRGLSMDELATIANCSKQAISNYENGLRTPDSKMQLSIANALEKDLDYFYNNNSIEFTLNNVYYREGDQLSAIQKNQVIEHTSACLNYYLELEQIAKELIIFQNPLEDIIIKNTSEAEKAAKQLRKKWKLGNEPIYNICGLLEKKGIRILKINFGFNYNHEGLSGWAEGKIIPVIILNARQQDLARTRFTILHELGHLLLEIDESVTRMEIEKICDAFAGAVLLPAEIIEIEFGKNRTAISIPELKRIKETYGISVKAIMVRARVTNLISYEAYNKWRVADYPDAECGQYMGTEEPQRFLQMLYRCLSEQKIGFDKAAKLSGEAEDEFRRIYTEKVEF